jgi:hypothetical protein
MPVTESTRVDRERFLFLVAALTTAASCGPPRSAIQTSPEPHSAPVSPGDPITRASEAPTVFVESPTMPEPETNEPEAPANSACDNEVGRVDCSRISSSICEGLAGSCNGLDDLYRPRVAEVIALCWAQMGDRACNIRARESCHREGFRHACLDPAFEPECEANIQRCVDAGARVSYTVEECVQVLSSVIDKGEREWASSAMGPTREGCKLMFPMY